jgi:hypothetical protein
MAGDGGHGVYAVAWLGDGLSINGDGAFADEVCGASA